MKNRGFCLLLALMLLMTACTPGRSEQEGLASKDQSISSESNSEHQDQPEDEILQMVSQMTLKDKLTQMMMVDFRQWGGSDFTVMNEDVRQTMEAYRFGAVIYFANNIKTTEEAFQLTKEFQNAATKDGGIPLFIAADQEGGSVYRLGRAQRCREIWLWEQPTASTARNLPMKPVRSSALN